MRYHLLSSALLIALAGPVMAAPPVAPEAAQFFESKVRPVLAEHCYRCHGPEKQKAGLRLDSRAFLLKGSDGGAVISDKDPSGSLLLKAVRHEGDLKMPSKKLPDPVIADLTAWVKMGAPWPESGVDPKDRPRTVAEVRESHWSFRPVKKPAVPAVKNQQWPLGELDRFILAELEKRGLAPSPQAERRTLLRRLSLDLTGLPPTPDEVDAFLKDKSSDAYERQVDRLLASPAYGERWARHWLDVARYADTRGYVFTSERRFPFSFTYRDYVIGAFNRDLPYDQFILQQLAADQLPLGEDKRPLAAMGFLTLGRRFLNNTHDIIDDRMDVTMRGLNGLTISCARCHDHKYDPVPIADYYSLYGVFASSVEPAELPTLGSPAASPEAAAFKAELARLQKELDDYKEQYKEELKARNRKHRDEVTRRQKKIDTLKATHPGAPASAMVLVDAQQPSEPVVFLRGNPNNRGPRVARQLPEVLARGERKPFNKGSGRLELAQALASKDNPLTARVMVNRVWMHHFGQGIVRTPGDFGLRGEPPTHPELLDWLAARFVEDGWSVKKLHRLILTSQAYRQVCDDNDAGRKADPENRLVWKMNRQRLEFEPLRDSLLFVSGQLDTKRGGKSVDLLTMPFTKRRTVYGFIERQNLPGVFRTFDFASPDSSTPQRHETTVPQQALFLMNSPFVVELSKALAARPDVTALQQPARRIERLYLLCYGRPPEAEEVQLGEQFIARAEKEQAAAKDRPPVALNAWEQYAQVLLLANEFCHAD